MIVVGQTAGWTKMPLGTEVGLGPGDFVFDGDPALPQKKMAQPPPNFWPMPILWTNGWMDQDATWYGGKPRPMRRYVRWGRSCPLKGAQPPVFPHVYCGQTAGWMRTPLGTEVDLGPGHIVLDRDPAPPRPKEGHNSPPLSFLPMSIVTVVAHLSYC